MNLKRFLRTMVMLLLIGSFTIGLTSCKLPASKGPQTASETNDGFPVPGETQQTGGINVSTFATQTAQANPPVVIDTSSPSENPPTSISPEATSVPGAPEPTAAPITYVTATPGGPPATYTLESGEFPFCIARRFDVSIAELLTLNGLTVNSLVSPGLELKIPQTGTPFDGDRSLHEHPTYYKIQSGDTLNSIACYFGDVSPDMIALQNNLSSNDLPVGEVLIIP
jgi:LysM repeat protein